MKKEERIAKTTIEALENAKQKWSEKTSVYRAYGIDERDVAETEVKNAFLKLHYEVDFISISLEYAHFLLYSGNSTVYDVKAYRELRSVTITKMRVVEENHIHVEN